MDSKKGGFTETPPESLNWRFRRLRLLEETQRHKIDGRSPDIIALQEVDHFYEFFQPELRRLGYDGRFIAKPNSPCLFSLDPTLEDGCAIFWRTDLLTLVSCDTLNYDQLKPDGTPTNKKSNQVALLATLRPAGAATPLVVAVTHLAAKKTAEGERTRTQQISQLLDALAQSAAGRLPCILAADMNATPSPGSGPDSYPSEAYPAAMAHPLGLRSVFSTAAAAARTAGGDPRAWEPAYTTWKRRGAAESRHVIDYLLAGPGVGVAAVLAAPDDAAVDPGRLPGWRYPSDHLALAAQLVLPAAAGPSSA